MNPTMCRVRNGYFIVSNELRPLVKKDWRVCYLEDIPDCVGFMLVRVIKPYKWSYGQRKCGEGYFYMPRNLFCNGDYISEPLIKPLPMPEGVEVVGKWSLSLYDRHSEYHRNLRTSLAYPVDGGVSEGDHTLPYERRRRVVRGELRRASSAPAGSLTEGVAEGYVRAGDAVENAGVHRISTSSVADLGRTRGLTTSEGRFRDGVGVPRGGLADMNWGDVGRRLFGGRSGAELEAQLQAARRLIEPPVRLTEEQAAGILRAEGGWTQVPRR